MENITQGQWFRGPSADLGDPIDQSLRFVHDNTHFLRRDWSDQGDRQTWTFSTWLKKGDYGSNGRIWTEGEDANTYFTSLMFQSADDTLRFYSYAGGTITHDQRTTHRFRDESAWYHIVVAMDTTAATASDRIKIYINGEQVTEFQSGYQNFPGQGFNTFVGYNGGHANIGQYVNGSSGGVQNNFGGYMAETIFIDGSQLAVTEFGRFNDDGVWVPKTYDGSYSGHSWRLQYDSSAGLGDDSSGLGNDFTAYNFDTTAISSSNPLSDVDYLDTPTRNFSTWNPLHKGGTVANSLRDGNLVTAATSSEHGVTLGEKIPGKDLYFEIDNGYGSSTFNWGNWWNAILLHNGPKTTAFGSVGSSANGVGFVFDIAANVYANNDSGTNQISSSSNANTIYGVKITDSQITLTKDGNSTNVTNLNFANNFDKGIYIYGKTAATNANETQRINFGQQAFLHEPSNVTKLETDEIAEPTIKNGKKHFDTVVYQSASTAADVTINTLEFQPDLIWIKSRSAGSNHEIYDSVRGVNKELSSDTNSAEQTTADSMKSFDSNGFTLGTGQSNINYNSRTYVAWCWKAGGTAVSNTDGTTTSSVSANTDAGFSIVSYTGDSPNARTVGHGLNSAPEVVLVKDRDSSSFHWQMWHTNLSSADHSLLLNSTQSESDYNSWQNTAPTSSVVYLGGVDGVNTNGNDYIMYCWHSVEGFSKFGEYTGNANSDGPFIYTGFKPALVVVKARTQIEDWFVYDNARHPNNPCEKIMRWNTAGTESGTGNDIDFLSNGFKIRNAINDVNRADPFIYMAFAEHPFGGKNQPPVTAR